MGKKIDVFAKPDGDINKTLEYIANAAKKKGVIIRFSVNAEMVFEERTQSATCRQRFIFELDVPEKAIKW